MTHVILVRDDARMPCAATETLQATGFSVDIATDEGAIARILDDPPDAVILDTASPRAMSICLRVRDRYPGPIVILSSLAQEVDQILGLELGADEYLANTVSPRLLQARLRALLRRSTAKQEAKIARFGSLVVDSSRRRVTVAGVTVDLSTAEFDLLWLLASRAGEIWSRDALIQQLRGIEYDGLDRSIDMRISKLRQKLDSAAANRIRTVRGIGYLFAP